MEKTKGFTLVEAAVAIGIVAILSGIIVPLVLKNLQDARNARARNDLQVIAAAMAAQLKDTGRRPNAAGGPGAVPGAGVPPIPLFPGASGVGDAIWYSGGALPVVSPAPMGAPAGYTPLGGPGAQLFRNLFSVRRSNQANALFGYPAGHPAQAGTGYKGPYLDSAMCLKSDPWGRAYVVLGYNARGEGSDGPIWLFSAGPAGTVNPNNLTQVIGTGRYRPVWTFAGASAGNLALRVQ